MRNLQKEENPTVLQALRGIQSPPAQVSIRRPAVHRECYSRCSTSHLHANQVSQIEMSSAKPWQVMWKDVAVVVRVSVPKADAVQFHAAVVPVSVEIMHGCPHHRHLCLQKSCSNHGPLPAPLIVIGPASAISSTAFRHLEHRGKSRSHLRLHLRLRLRRVRSVWQRHRLQHARLA